MTDILDRETLIELSRHVGWPAVSIHMPTHRSGPEIQQDPIRFKNLLKTATERLAGHLRMPEIETLLAPAFRLQQDAGFWRESADGLAVFLGEDETRVFRLEIELPEAVTVAERYTIRPLLAALNTGERFFVLALSKKRVRLLEGDAAGVRELDLTGVPESLAEALKYDDFERQVQFHSRTPAAAAGRGRRAAVFHGHGGIPDVEKENVARFFRAVDRGIHELLRDDDAPLLLAGVEYLMPIYREVNSYPHLVDAALTGNPDEMTPQELHAQARDVLRPHFRAEFESDLRTWRELSGVGGASEDIREIVPAAHEGRVRVLFVSPHSTVWGAFDPSSARVDVRDEPRPDDWDLADLAAAETLLHGGVVHAVGGSPGEPESAAAIFRY